MFAPMGSLMLLMVDLHINENKLAKLFDMLFKNFNIYLLLDND